MIFTEEHSIMTSMKIEDTKAETRTRDICPFFYREKSRRLKAFR
ncbi:hypothetical protein [Salibacterium sp. K-3]